MSMHEKGIVASGHELVSRTAAQIMRAGGNAFDAVVAAGFASAVTEQTLNSLGGGGLLLGWSEKQHQAVFFDFFVDTPGLGRSCDFTPHFFPVTVNFSGTGQYFNVGMGSVAVPGTLKGLLHTHKRLGYMDLKDVLAPAKALAREHVLNKQQAHFLQLLYPIMTLTEDGKEIYEPNGSYLQAGNTVKNPDCADFIDQVAEDRGRNFYLGDIARAIARDMNEGKGFLSTEDLAHYQVVERAPLTIPYRNYQLCTSAEPSIGGTLLGLSLGLTEKLGLQEMKWGSGVYLKRMVDLMRQVERLRADGISTPHALKQFLENDQKYRAAAETIRMFSRGTTHISISDRQGNCASMTCSNGEGSGYFAPGTGVMLNNMMGEDDLHPHGFHTGRPGIRVGSMMSPSLLFKDGRVRLVIGSGGSKRIRTSMSQVLSQIVEFRRTLAEAVSAPRLYLDGEVVQVEPGFSRQSIEALRDVVGVNEWDRQDVYFGGVHGVVPGVEGVGDQRRGGAVAIV